MPSAAVHLTVADMLKKELNIGDDSAFYLGAIAPDAVNINGFAEEKIRYAAHLRNKDYGKWKENIEDYYISEHSGYCGCEDFFKGFLLHLYTDIAWDETVQPKLFEYLKAAGFSDNELNREKWNELDRLDAVIRRDTRYKAVLEKLAKARGKRISTVDASQLEKYRDIILSESSESKNEGPHFLNYDAIAAAAGRACGYMKKLPGIKNAETVM